jgi:hypothetical protein
MSDSGVPHQTFSHKLHFWFLPVQYIYIYIYIHTHTNTPHPGDPHEVKALYEEKEEE